MNWLNYHHYYYFWVVAQSGSIASAAKRLNLATSTVSGQINQFENDLDTRLFQREGRRLSLTADGRLALRYADEIFALGHEFLGTLHAEADATPTRLHIGITDVIPKLLVRRLIEPALEAFPGLMLSVEEESHHKLLDMLSSHRLDLILSDAPVPPASHFKAFNHSLGESGMSFLACGEQAERLASRFPDSLDGADTVLPLKGTHARRGLEFWFDHHKISPHIRGEFADTALIKIFGADGFGFFAVPSVIEADSIEQTGGALIGRTDEVTTHFYAISSERRVRNPAVTTILEAASRVFGR